MVTGGGSAARALYLFAGNKDTLCRIHGHGRRFDEYQGIGELRPHS
jgi:hypothetical protein